MKRQHFHVLHVVCTVPVIYIIKTTRKAKCKIHAVLDVHRNLQGGGQFSWLVHFPALICPVLWLYGLWLLCKDYAISLLVHLPVVQRSCCYVRLPNTTSKVSGWLTENSQLSQSHSYYWNFWVTIVHACSSGPKTLWTFSVLYTDITGRLYSIVKVPSWV